MTVLFLVWFLGAALTMFLYQYRPGDKDWRFDLLLSFFWPVVNSWILFGVIQTRIEEKKIRESRRKQIYQIVVGKLKGYYATPAGEDNFWVARTVEGLDPKLGVAITATLEIDNLKAVSL